MLDNEVNELLNILDKYEINLDIDDFELSLLPNGLVNYLNTLNSRNEIIHTLSAHIYLLKYKLMNNIENNLEKSL